MNTNILKKIIYIAILPIIITIKWIIKKRLGKKTIQKIKIISKLMELGISEAEFRNLEDMFMKK